MDARELEQRTRELESEITRIQQGLENSVVQMKDQVTTSVKQWSRPETWVRHYPITTVVVAAAAGVVVGKLITGKARKTLKPAQQSAGAAEAAPAPRRKKSLMSFLKPFAAQAWEQFGPAVIAYGQQAVAQRAQVMMEEQAAKAADRSKSL